MTRDEILNMEGGREMDALVAENVMGLEVVHYEWPCGGDPECGQYEAQAFIDDHSFWKDDIGPVFLPPNGDWPPYFDNDYGCWVCFVEPVPFYSTYVHAAWDIVNKFAHTARNKIGRKQGFSHFHIVGYPDSGWVVRLGQDGKESISVHSDDVLLAICRAALIAMLDEDE